MLWEKLGCRGELVPFPSWEDFPESGFRQSAVLALLCGEPPDLRILLIRRPMHLNRHAGEIAFPGGKREPEDRGPVETALRETREELGLDTERVSFCRLLDKVFAHSSDFEIHPILALLGSRESLFPLVDRNEVDEVFLPPVGQFYRPSRLEWARHGKVQVLFPVFETLGGYRVWGATARILWQVGRILEPIMEETSCR